MLVQSQVEKAKKTFQLFDKDKSGSIDLQELREALKTMGLNPTEGEVTKMMEEIDDNGSGTIDFVEFLSLVEQQTKPAETEHDDDLIGAFVALGGNEDKTGRVEVDNLRKGLRAFELEIDVDELLGEANCAGATSIDFEIFKAILG